MIGRLSVMRGHCTSKVGRGMAETDRSGYSRRSILTALAATPLSAVGIKRAAAQTVTAMPAEGRVQAALKEAQGTKLVMLGTGAGPVPMAGSRRRFMTSHVMLSKGAAYVLDFGLGATNEFSRTGIEFGAVRSVFITHHHPDHNWPRALTCWCTRPCMFRRCRPMCGPRLGATRRFLSIH